MERNIDLGRVVGPEGPKGDSRYNDGYAEGSAATDQSSAGALGWQWTAVTQPASGDYTIAFTVSDATGIYVGDRVSCKAGYSWNFFGAVTAKNGNTITVTCAKKRSEWPSNFTPWSTAGYFWLPDNPAAGNVKIGGGAFAIGIGNKANELGALAIGNNNIADGRGSFAGGNSNEAGYASMAFGVENTVDATMSGAIGYKNTIKGYHSLANGESNTASGQNSHAEGIRSVASGNESHAEGGATQATGNYSHSEGENTVAVNRGSHAEGFKTITNADYQHVEGQYNSPNAAFAYIIGRGTSENARKNIFAVSNGGGLALKGNVYVDANDNSTGGKILATQEFVNAQKIVYRYDVTIRMKVGFNFLFASFTVYTNTKWTPTSLSDIKSALTAAGYVNKAMNLTCGEYYNGSESVKLTGIYADSTGITFEGFSYSDYSGFNVNAGPGVYSDYTVSAVETAGLFR